MDLECQGDYSINYLVFLNVLSLENFWEERTGLLFSVASLKQIFNIHEYMSYAAFLHINPGHPILKNNSIHLK